MTGKRYASTITTCFLVGAVGQLNSPHFPELPGFKDYRGKVMHSVQWDSNFDMERKRVALIGTGASSAQILPHLSSMAAPLTVFQRTPNWIVPRDDDPIPQLWRLAYRYLPLCGQRRRAKLLKAREQSYRMLIEPEINAMVKEINSRFMERQLPDQPELWEKLTPRYPPGCKRVLLSDEYYPTLNKSNVTLDTRAIQKLTQKGIMVDDEEIEVDVIIFATGFRAQEFLSHIDIYGLDGRSLKDIWRNGPHAYLGMTVNSLPNFAMLYGPNTNLGHNSALLMIEAQSRYISALIRYVMASRRKVQALCIVQKSQRIKDYNDDLQVRLQETAFTDSGCSSWYKTQNGTVTNNWYGTAAEYQDALSLLVWDDFDGAEPSKKGRTERIKQGENFNEAHYFGFFFFWVLLSGVLVGKGITLVLFY